ncbi:GDSL esterase/lipase [Melia azedarach]|uniref:GDSL esterase/lipase n=1 Tax=Melia azedarach TaxID=155640 RepID=A0ACC1XTC4_MELAZ|nr:GDSL esterase/lipase [Melia azedarach]
MQISDYILLLLSAFSVHKTMKFISRNPTSFSSSTFTFMALLLVVVYENGAAALTNNETVPAVFVFGDSIVDPGNNNNVKTIVKCNFPPYGRDFMGGKPTGRFCNGNVPSDFIAQGFGVKDLLPAYLDPNLKPQDLVTGVSFASGGNGYDPLTAKIVSVLSLSDQLELFKKSLTNIKETVGEAATASILSKSIFMVCTGSDDIANTYFSTPFRRTHYDINSYTDLTVSSASSFLQDLYGVGARRIGVFSAPPIGCVPSQRTLGGGIARGCSDSANQAAQIFNSKLESLLDSLNQKFPDSRFVYIDVYGPLLSLIQNPAQYGFEVVNKGCCGTGNIEVSVLCNRLEDAHTCPDASKYVFWDSYHPTEAAYKILSNQVLSKVKDKFF